jgi:hypothetical protein
MPLYVRNNIADLMCFPTVVSKLMLPECNYPCLKMDEKPRIQVQFIRESILLTLYQANTMGMILISNINITKKYTQNSKQLNEK